MKVLFVLTDDYPIAGACTSLLKNLFFEGRLAKKLQRLDVLTVKHKWDQPSVSEVNGIKVYRILLWSRLSNKEIRKSFNSHFLSMTWGVLHKLLHKAYKIVFPKKYFYSLDIKKILKWLDMYNTNQYDAFVVVAGDFHMAEAVRLHVAKTNNQQFILYQVDPCVTRYTEPKITMESRLRFEENVYTSAESILVTPILHKEMLLRYKNQYSHKLYSIEFPNVSGRDNVTTNSNDLDGNNISCVFAGNIYGGIRSPNYTLKLFEEMDDENIGLVIIGNSDVPFPAKSKKLNIVSLGPQNLDTTQKKIAEADFLVNIGNIMLNQVPSKLFEYISSGKPIINICKNRQCPTLLYMEKYPLVINLFEEDEILKEQAKRLRSFIYDNLGKKLQKKEIMKLFEKSTPKYCAEQILEVLKIREGRV